MYRTATTTAVAAIVAMLSACATPAAQVSHAEPGQLKFDSCAKPMYPAQSLAARHEGTVTVMFAVGADGKVNGASVLKPSGHPLLDDAALQALKLCSFRAATKDGQPVASSIPVQYVWPLTEPKLK
jgi:bla regulator protein BlaR1